MYRIGEFSRISGISIKMLRYFDTIGLLPPAHIDPDSGYRYYALGQLLPLHRILALREMGFSYAEIIALLHSTAQPQIDTALQVKRAELAAELRDVQARLQRLAVYEQLTRSDGKLPEYEIVLKSNAGQPPPLLPAPSVERVTLPLPRQSGFDHDILLARAALIKRAEKLACVVHRGGAATLALAYAALERWLAAHHYKIAGLPNEIIHEAKAGEELLEVQLPIYT